MRYYFHFPVFCVVALFALPFSPMDAIAGESNAEAAKRIYDWAQSLKDTFTYTASGASENNRNAIYFKQANPDGTTYSKSIFEHSYGSNTYLTNRDGEYRIIGDIAIKSAFVRVSQRPDYNDYASFSMQYGTYQGISCYIIKKQLADNESFFSAFVRNLPNEEKKGKSKSELRSLFLASVSPVEVYYIGRVNGFIYSHQLYSAAGKLRFALSYTNVVFVDRLPENTFDLPAGVEISIAKDWDEYINKTTDASIERFDKNHSRLRQPDGWTTRLGNYFKHNYDLIISSLTRIFIVMGIISIILLIYFRISQRHSRF